MSRIAAGIAQCQRCRHATKRHSDWGDSAQVGEAPDSCSDCIECAERNLLLATVPT